MKTLSIMLLSLLSAISCNVLAQQNLKNTTLEYVATTRGFYERIVIKNQTISVTNDRDAAEMPAATKISTADWKILNSEFQKLKLETIKDLVAPSEKRHTDAAAFGKLKIRQDKNEYSSNEFDNANPPEAIAKFTNKIMAIAKKLKSK